MNPTFREILVGLLLVFIAAVPMTVTAYFFSTVNEENNYCTFKYGEDYYSSFDFAGNDACCRQAQGSLTVSLDEEKHRAQVNKGTFKQCITLEKEERQ